MANTSFEKKLFNALKYGQIQPKSVYEIWLEAGNEGTPEDFIRALSGSINVKGITLSAANWVEYLDGYKFTITDTNITNENVVSVNITSTNIESFSNKYSISCINTIEGGFEIFLDKLPTVDLVIDYAIH